MRASTRLLIIAALLSSCGPARESESDAVRPRQSDSAATALAGLPTCASGPAPADQWPRLDQGPFSLQLPPDYARREVQGIDSHVGQFTAEGRTLGFDFGWYSNPLSSPDNAALRDYRACRDVTADRPARIVTARRDTAYFAGAAWRQVSESAGGVNHLTITVESRDSLGQAEALRVFRSVRFR